MNSRVKAHPWASACSPFSLKVLQTVALPPRKRPVRYHHILDSSGGHALIKMRILPHLQFCKPFIWPHYLTNLKSQPNTAFLNGHKILYVYTIDNHVLDEVYSPKTLYPETTLANLHYSHGNLSTCSIIYSPIATEIPVGA